MRGIRSASVVFLPVVVSIQIASAFQSVSQQSQSLFGTNNNRRRVEVVSTVVVVSTSSSTALRSESSDVNGGDSGNNGSGLVTQSDANNRSQLFSAFTNLDLSDQYDAVLTGLCAKILDNDGSSNSDSNNNSNQEVQAGTALLDCTALLQEMNDSRIAASPRSLMAMIDSTVKTQDAETMANVMSQCAKNVKGVVQYGGQQTDVLMMPSNIGTAKVLCPDGKRKTVTERLLAVADVPTDDRAAETVSAIGFAATAVACEATNLLGATDFQLAANTVLALMITVTAIDNFYDILKSGSQMAMKQVDNKAVKDFKLPDKDTLPLGLGSGVLTGSVVRGLTRLLTVDAERESQCEAAALYTAYVLGLPCFAFRPNALEASVLVVQSTTDNNNNLLTDSGTLRMLVWLMAPTAMESMTHPQLIMSDPREAAGFLQRLEDYYATNGNAADAADLLFWTESDEQKAALLKWAYTEATLLLRANKATVTEISNRLTSGAATIGDCIAVIEGW